MPFFKLDDVTDFEAYKKARNASLSRIGEKPFTFLYSKKHNFTKPSKKTQPLFVFENGKIDGEIVKAAKAATSGGIAEGMCHKNQDGVVVFDLTKGDLDGFDMFPKFQVGADQPPQAPPQPSSAAGAEPKGGEQEAEAEQEEEESPDYKIRLVNGLKKVKTANGKEGFAFVACIAKPFYGVLFGKNPKEQIGPTHKKVLTDLTQGTRFIVGHCLFENNAHTFVVDPPPGGLAKKLQLALKEFTGQAYKVRVRDTESKTVADGDTDVDPEEEQAAAATAQAKAQEGAAFKQRLAALQPQIAKATASKTPQGEEIKQRAAEMGASASKGNFGQANEILDAIEALLKTVPTSPPPPSSAQTPKAPAPSADGNGQKDIKLSTYLSGRANLRKAREAAEKGLKELQAAILAKSKDEPFYPEIEAKSQRLFDFLKPIDDSVADKLDEAGRCTDPEVQAELNKKVRELIQKQLAEMRGHPLASFVEKNPFGKFVIKQPIEVTLSALDQQLA